MSFFLRQNAGAIAAGISTVYFSYFGFGSFAAGDIESKILRDENGNEIHLGLQAEKNLKTLIHRLEWTHRSKENLLFYVTKELDYTGSGFILSKSGATLGLPPSYLAQTESDLLKYLPNGFTYCNHHFSWKQFENTNLEQMLILSNDARKFGIVCELNAIEHPRAVYFSFLDTLLGYSAFILCHRYNIKTNYKTSILFRSSMYTAASVATIGIAFLLRKLLLKFHEFKQDKKAIFCGIDLAHGSVEYYDKLIKRNKIIRDFMHDGDKYIDESGNLKKSFYNLPFIDVKIEYPNYGFTLEERKDNCEKLLNEFIKEAQMNQDVVKEDRELEFFKKIKDNLSKSQK